MKLSKMLYVGHFWFDGQQKNGAAAEPTHGWFSGFDSVNNVYLDDITEVKGVPGRGVLAHFTEYYGDSQPLISMSLPGTPQEFYKSYGWGPVAEDDDEGVTMEPFVSFEDPDCA